MKKNNQIEMEQISVIDKIIIEREDSLTVSDIDKLMVKYPNSDYLLGCKINYLSKESRFDEAKEIIDTIDKKNCGTYLLCGIGEYYHWLGKLDIALSYYLRSIDRDKYKTNFWARAYIAYLYEDSSNIAEATKWYQIAINFKPNYHAVKFHYIKFLIDHQEADSAERIIQGILDYKPAETFAFYGDIKMIQKDYSKAKEYFKKSVNLDEWYSESNFGMIAACINLKEYDEAKIYIDKLKSLDSSNSFVWYYEGYSFYCQNKYENSIPYLEKAIELDNGIESYRIVLFLSYIKLKKYLKAKEVMNRTIWELGHDYMIDSHEILVKMFTKDKDVQGLIDEYNNVYNSKQIKFLHTLITDYGLNN